MLKVFVKVGNIKNLSDARYSAGMGVDQLGFEIGTEENQVSETTYLAIRDWVSGTEFVKESDENSHESDIPFDLYETSSMAHADSLLLKGKKVILKLPLEKVLSMEELPSIDYEYLLLTTSAAAFKENSSKIKNLATKRTIVLNITDNITPTLLADLTSMEIKGIALTGGDEIRPGFKDYDELADILEQLEID